MSEAIIIESSDQQRLELLWRVASLSNTLRHFRNSEQYQRRSQDGETVVIPVRIHGSILRKMVDLMAIIVDEPTAAVERFIMENRAILFQLALASMELNVPSITQTLRDTITAAIKGKSTDEIRSYFCIAETQSVVLSEEDDEGFELVASVIDRERSQRLSHMADHDSLVTACHFCKQEFSLTLRKHHCRKCFRVFCKNCANELVDMPDAERQRAESLIGTSALTKVRNFIWVLTLKRNPLTAARLCSVCVFEQNQDVRVAGTTSVFQLCRLELPELMALRGVCQSWTWAAELCVEDITRMLAALPTHVFTPDECELLWANRRHFVGHNRWMVQLLRSVAWGDRARAEEAEALLRTGTRQRDCKLLRCEATCQQTLTCSDAFELFASLTPVGCPKVRALLVDALRAAEVEDMRSFLPGLVRALADEDCPRSSALFLFLTQMAASDMEFGVQLYWALHVASLDPHYSIKYAVLRDLLLATLATTAGLATVNELLAGMELVDIVRQCTTLDTLPQIRDGLVPALARAGVLSASQSVRLPVTPSFEAVGISVEGIRRIDSHVAPTLLPFLGTSTKHAPPSPPASGYGVAAANVKNPPSDSEPHPAPVSAPPRVQQRSASAAVSAVSSSPGSTSASASAASAAGAGAAASSVKRSASFSTATAPTVAQPADSRVRTYQTLKVAFKKEDLRKDWIVQAILSYMHRCLSRDGIDVPVVTYRVLPTSARDGLVEWVPDAMNLTEIQQSYHRTLQNFIVNNNGEAQIDKVRRTFMMSLATSTIMTFLLLVGDRHKENMMIHRSGTFFHIDYGYVLGEDPKPLLRLNLALKTEMIDALGGEGNPLYREFRQFTTSIYNSLRKHASTIISMMLLLLRSLPEIETSCDPESLEKELISRFAVGRTDKEAEDILRWYMDGDLEAVIRGPLQDHMHDIPRNVQYMATAVTEHVKSLAGAAAGFMGLAAETASRHLPSLRLPLLYGASMGGPVPSHPWLDADEDDPADDDDADDDLADAAARGDEESDDDSFERTDSQTALGSPPKATVAAPSLPPSTGAQPTEGTAGSPSVSPSLSPPPPPPPSQRTLPIPAAQAPSAPVSAPAPATTTVQGSPPAMPAMPAMPGSPLTRGSPPRDVAVGAPASGLSTSASDAPLRSLQGLATRVTESPRGMRSLHVGASPPAAVGAARPLIGPGPTVPTIPTVGMGPLGASPVSSSIPTTTTTTTTTPTAATVPVHAHGRPAGSSAGSSLSGVLGASRGDTAQGLASLGTSTGLRSSTHAHTLTHATLLPHHAPAPVDPRAIPSHFHAHSHAHAHAHAPATSHSPRSAAATAAASSYAASSPFGAHLVSLSPPPPSTTTVVPGQTTPNTPLDFLLFDSPTRASTTTATVHGGATGPAGSLTFSRSGSVASPASSGVGGSMGFFNSPSAGVSKYAPAPRSTGIHARPPLPPRAREEGTVSPDLSDDNFEDTQDSL